MSLNRHCDVCGRTLRPTESYVDVSFAILLRFERAEPVRQGESIDACLACVREEKALAKIREQIASRLLLLNQKSP